MSESGHSQPGLYGIERRRRWKEPGSGGPQNLSGPGGRERDYIAPWERERRDASEETSTSVMQKTPIILSKPPAERSKQPPPPTAPAAPPAPAPLEKPIVLMKPREEGKGPVAVTGASTPE
ncbi:SMG9 nonsense mediated mRNA decay factor, partial [Homo sapiens]